VTRTAVLEAELATASAAGGLGAQTVVAIPPTASDVGRMRVHINGVATLRRFDDELEQP
jgi:hypothetical protein